MQSSYDLLAISDRVLQKTPFSFDVSVWEFWWPFKDTVRRLILAKPGGHQDPYYLSEVIDRK